MNQDRKTIKSTILANGECPRMPEQTAKSLNHFALFSFSPNYYSLPSSERRETHKNWLAGLRSAAQNLDVYQAYPAQAGADVLVWSALEVEESCSTATFFSQFAQATNPFRHLLRPVQLLWGYTKPSQYTKTRSTQEIDPFAQERKPYLVMYPFVKTADWYLMSREARQGMMNEHIKIGKQYPEITQLLLYSFGVQDQEFIVVYETADLQQFSDLVYELRDSEARRYTLRDAPLYTAVHHPPAETLALWE
jgi:chlorite dismutase